MNENYTEKNKVYRENGFANTVKSREMLSVFILTLSPG